MTMQKVTHLADRSARTYQALMDALMASVVLFVTLAFFGWVLPLLPGLDDGVPFGTKLCTGMTSCDYTWIERVDRSSGPSFWVSVLLASLAFLLVSGAFSKTRRSPGMVVASTYPVLTSSVGSADCTPPGSMRMLARWAIVLGLFVAGSYVGGNGLWGILLVTAAWAPSLFGSKLALHDVLTGTAVVMVALETTPKSAPTTIS
jgi:hypothetical protein